MRIVVGLPQTGFQRPADKELLALLKIVSAAHPREARETAAPEFARAFHAVGFFFRTAAPRRDRHFVHFVDRASELLRDRWDCAGVTAPALLLAVRAHNDIPWRPQDLQHGQLAEIGLDEFHGLPLRSPNAWVGLLKGGNLREPTPPDPRRAREPERMPVKYYRLNPGGQLYEHAAADDEPLWTR